MIEQVALIQISLETPKPNFIAMELIIFPYIFRRIVNDSLRTDVCLLYPPYLIALGKFVLNITVIMPPTLKKLMGHIAFGACVRASHFLYLL